MTPQTFTIKKDDTGPTIMEYLYDSDGSPINLTGASVEFHLLDPDGSTITVNSAATIADATTGKVSYAWQAADTDTAGVFKREWQITFGSGMIVTVPNDGIGYPVIITTDIAD